jgi:hypothetical protein
MTAPPGPEMTAATRTFVLLDRSVNARTSSATATAQPNMSAAVRPVHAVRLLAPTGGILRRLGRMGQRSST